MMASKDSQQHHVPQVSAPKGPAVLVGTNLRTRGDTTGRVLAVYAGPCPESGKAEDSKPHQNTVVYATKGRTRHCKCNDCGHTWKNTGEFAERWREYVMQLAETLAQTERRDVPGGERVIVLRATDVDAICQELTKFVEAG